MTLPINQIICGDCLEVMKSFPDKSVDLVLTDPPYGIRVQHKNCAASRNDLRSNELIQWDNLPPKEETFEQIYRIGEDCIIWGANYFNCFSDSGGAIVWDKEQPLPDSSQCEIASYSRLKKVFKYTQIWTNFVNTKVSEHPTEKPIGLMKWCIQQFSQPSDLILDPFCGSGTTCVAAELLGRRWIGIEISEKYCEIARKRVKQAQDQFALLEMKK